MRWFFDIPEDEELRDLMVEQLNLLAQQRREREEGAGAEEREYDLYEAEEIAEEMTRGLRERHDDD